MWRTIKCSWRLHSYENQILAQFQIASPSRVSLLGAPGDGKQISILHQTCVRAKRITWQRRSWLVFELAFQGLLTGSLLMLFNYRWEYDLQDWFSFFQLLSFYFFLSDTLLERGCKVVLSQRKDFLASATSMLTLGQETSSKYKDSRAEVFNRHGCCFGVGSVCVPILTLFY